MPPSPSARALALAVLEACGAEHAAQHADVVLRRVQAGIDDDGDGDGDGSEAGNGRALPAPFDRARVRGAGGGWSSGHSGGGHFRPSRGVRLFCRAHGTPLLRALLADLAEYAEWGTRRLAPPPPPPPRAGPRGDSGVDSLEGIPRARRTLG